MAKSNKPIVWGPFAAGGTLTAFLTPALIALTLLAGLGGSRGYLDVAAFARAGVRVEFQQFRHPQYRQCGPQPFIPGLSALDALFSCGQASRAMLRGEGTPQLSRVAA